MADRARVAPLLAGLLASVAGLVITAERAAADDDLAALAATAEAEGSVRVVVELDVRTVPEPLLTDAAASRQRDRIDAAVAELVEELPDDVDVKAFETVPSMVVEATPEALDALVESGEVTDIIPERSAVPMLDTSVRAAGADTVLGAGWDGSGQSIAVLDTGVASGHVFFAGTGTSRVVAQACFSSQGSCPGATTVSTAPGAGEPCTFHASCDHGTHVAGVAAGRQAPGNPGPTSGVAPDAGIVAVQVFSNVDGAPSASSIDIGLALDWILDTYETYDIAAVNLSLGSTSTFDRDCDDEDPVTAALIRSLAAAGVPTVVASGNGGDAAGMSWPACLSRAVAVGSTNDAGDVSSFSNVSSTIDLLAPGQGVESSVPRGFATKSGTSLAAPHVAGAWAALREARTAAGFAPNVDVELAAIRASGPLADDTVVTNIPRLDLARALAPGAPTSVIASAHGEQATVSWAAPSWTGAGQIVGYDVLSWPLHDAAAVTTTPVGLATSTTVTGAGDATARAYVVRAVNASGPGPHGAAAVVTVPAAPTDVAATAGDRRAVVSWTAPTNGNSPITNYRITVSPPTGVSGDVARLVGSATTSFAFSGLAADVTYSFVVTAINAAGESAPSTPSNAITPRRSSGGGGGGGGGRSTTTTTRPSTSTTTRPPSTTTTTPVGDGDDEFDAVPSSPGAAVTGGRVATIRDRRAVIVPAGAPADANIVAGAVTPSGSGAWSVTAEGRVFTSGDAPHAGSTTGQRLNAPIVAIAPTPSGRGYWLLGRDGGIFTYGDAAFFGSTGSLRLNQPVVGMASTASGRGYWLFAGDGGIFTFGDARFHGSTGALRLNAPITTMAATPSGLGYWLLGTDGGVFTFGDARFAGSTAGSPGAAHVRALVPTRSGRGYWLIAHDGEIRSFGDAR